MSDIDSPASLRAAVGLLRENIAELEKAYAKKDISKAQYEKWMGRYRSQMEDIPNEYK
jgi:hypothetical protein